MSRESVQCWGGKGWRNWAVALTLAWALLLPTCQRWCYQLWAGRQHKWMWSAVGATHVRVECWRAKVALVRQDGRAGEVRIRAHPRLLPQSYHGPEPIPTGAVEAQKWKFAWARTDANGTVTLHCEGERKFRHHRYFLEAVEVIVPAGTMVELVRSPLAEL